MADKFENLSPYNYASNNPVTCIDLWGTQGIFFDLAIKLGVSAAMTSNKYSSILEKGQPSAQRIFSGRTSLSAIPQSVQENMGSSAKNMISTSSKINDINKVVETTKELIIEGTNDIGNTAKATGNVLTVAGLVLAIPSGGTSLALIPVGEGISSFGSSAKIGSNLLNGDTKQAMEETGSLIVGALINSGTSSILNKSKSIGAIKTQSEEVTQTTLLGGVGEMFKGLFSTANKNLDEKN